MILAKALPLPPSPPSSVASTPDAYTKALSSLLSVPSASSAFPMHAADLPQRTSSTGPHSSPSSSKAGRGSSGDNRSSDLRRGDSVVSGGGSSNSTVTYRVFLEHLGRPESEGFVKAIRLFLFSILGNGGAANPAAGRPQAAANRDIRRETEDVEVYGSSFLVQR